MPIDPQLLYLKRRGLIDPDVQAGVAPPLTPPTSPGISASQVGAAAGIASTGLSAIGGPKAGVASGALSGAAAGAPLGPVGAGVGATVGLIGGLAGIRQQRKAEKRAIEVSKQKAIAQIEEQRGQKQQAALANIQAALRSAFLG